MLFHFFVKEYNIETESTIRTILHSSPPIRLWIFCTLAINVHKMTRINSYLLKFLNCLNYVLMFAKTEEPSHSGK